MKTKAMMLAVRAAQLGVGVVLLGGCRIWHLPISGPGPWR